MVGSLIILTPSKHVARFPCRAIKDLMGNLERNLAPQLVPERLVLLLLRHIPHVLQLLCSLRAQRLLQIYDKWDLSLRCAMVSLL
jgi:hypothetical protein